MGGRSTFTLLSRKTGNHLSFKVAKHKSKPCWFVSGRVESTYDFIGVIFEDGNFNQTRKPMSDSAKQKAKAFGWWWAHRDSDQAMLIKSQFCCVCGRTLTDPESCSIGVGPECRKRI